MKKFAKLLYIYKRVKNSIYNRIVYAPGMDSLYRIFQEIRIRHLRKKDIIKVLFIVGEASTWKTEMLYKKMLAHPRFKPVIGIITAQWFPKNKDILISYLKKKDYNFIDLDNDVEIINKIKPDIKFYYKPYETLYPKGIFFDKNLKSILCSINYGFNMSRGPVAFKHDIRRYAWKEFIENNLVIEAIKDAGKTIKNKAITGVPIQDYFQPSNRGDIDPWKYGNKKKRIIYAPHHSFKGYNANFIEYATFLEYGEHILSLAKKYSSEVYWVFKPHPSLKEKLIHIWGKEKTEDYFNSWENLGIGQVELGDYKDLFLYSDAMIHDCSSFLAEYMFTGNPVLFLEEKSRSAEEMFLSDFGYKAYKAHYHAQSLTQIENFITQIIKEEDPEKQKRIDFYNNYLLPPNGKSACENIIEVILGQKD